MRQILAVCVFAPLLLGVVACDDGGAIAEATSPESRPVAYSVLEVSMDAEGELAGHSRPEALALDAVEVEHGSLMTGYAGEHLTWIIDGEIEGLEGAVFTLPCGLSEPSSVWQGGDLVYRVRVPDGKECQGGYDMFILRSGGRVTSVFHHAVETSSASPSDAHARRTHSGEIKIPPT